jgi:hypothetical protein
VVSGRVRVGVEHEHRMNIPQRLQPKRARHDFATILHRIASIETFQGHEAAFK